MKKKSYLWLLIALLAMALCFGGCSDNASSDDEETRKEQRDKKEDDEDDKKDDDKSESDVKSEVDAKTEESSGSAEKKSEEPSESVEKKSEESSESIEKKSEEPSGSVEKKTEESSEPAESTEVTETPEQKPNGGITVSDQSIVGKWVSEPIDSLTDKLLDELGGFDEMKDYVNFDRKKIKFCIYFEFTADGRMIYGMDEESLGETMDYIATSLIDGVKVYIEKMFEESGMEMSFADYLKATGMSEEEFESELRDELYQYVDQDDMKEEGLYVVKNGRLYAAEASEGTVDVNHCESLSYTISGNKLTLLAYFDEDGQSQNVDVMDDLLKLPITLTRK